LEISQKRCIRAQKFHTKNAPLLVPCLEILSFKNGVKKIKYFLLKLNILWCSTGTTNRNKMAPMTGSKQLRRTTSLIKK